MDKALISVELIPELIQFFPRENSTEIDQYRIAMRALESLMKDEESPLKDVFLELADSGYAPADYILSFLHRYGIGQAFEEDPILAKKYCWKAARKGFIPSCYQRSLDLYQSYFKAKDALKDSTKERKYLSLAKHYLEMAAAAGHVQAMLSLGNHYLHGTDLCQQDFEKALLYFHNSAKSGDDYGRFKYAETCEQVFSKEKQSSQYLLKAQSSYKKLAEKGHPFAIRGLQRVQIKLTLLNEVATSSTCFGRVERQHQSQAPRLQAVNGQTMFEMSALKMFRSVMQIPVKKNQPKRDNFKLALQTIHEAKP